MMPGKVRRSKTNHCHTRQNMFEPRFAHGDSTKLSKLAPVVQLYDKAQQPELLAKNRVHHL
jgi:hypothetical protein